MRHLIFAGIVCFGTPAIAAEHNQANRLDMTCNEHGAIVKVLDGVAAGRTLYLGKSGDAYEPGVGEGKWWTAASGFIVEIAGNSTRFNSDPPC